MIAKPSSTKSTGGKSGGCARKAVELTSGDPVTWHRRSGVRLIKDFPDNADLPLMINPVSANEVPQQAARLQPPAQTATGSAVPQDKVTLNSAGAKSAGDPDHEGR